MLQIVNSVQGILDADSASKLAEIEALSGTWDGEARVVSKYVLFITFFFVKKTKPENRGEREMQGIYQIYLINEESDEFSSFKSNFTFRHAATLVQLDNGKKIPPMGWKCEKCDLDSNLWLNLTDGVILCGRKFYDGSGGNEHALQHYRETGNCTIA